MEAFQIEEVTTKKVIRCTSDVRSFFRSVFDNIDVDKDGLISLGELKTFLDNNELCNIPKKVITSVYKKYDTNKDDDLDFDEFFEMVTDPIFTTQFRRVARRLLKFIVVRKGSTRMRLERTITLTGTYEAAMSWNMSLLAMVLLTIIQITLYYIDLRYATWKLSEDGDWEQESQGPISLALKFDPELKTEFYRYITYAFVHADNGHLYGNVVIQIIIAIPLQIVHGWRAIIIYFIGAVAGCVTHSVMCRYRGNFNLRGSSGAVFSFFTANLAAVIMNWREMSHPAVHLIPYGVVVAVEVIQASLNPAQTVSYDDHVGGAVVGLLLGIMVLRNLRITKIEKIIWHVSFITLTVLCLVFIYLDVCLPREMGAKG